MHETHSGDEGTDFKFDITDGFVGVGRTEFNDAVDAFRLKSTEEAREIE